MAQTTVHTLSQSPSRRGRVYTQFYRGSDAHAFWAALDDTSFRLLFHLALDVNEAGVGHTSRQALGQLLGKHRTTIAKYLHQLSSWHGPDGAQQTPALLILPWIKHTPHGRRVAGFTYKIADWVPTSFGRTKAAPVSDQDATQACVSSRAATQTKKEVQELKKKTPPSLPPSQPLSMADEEDALATTPSPRPDGPVCSPDQEGQAAPTASLPPDLQPSIAFLRQFGVSVTWAHHLAQTLPFDVIQQETAYQQKVAQARAATPARIRRFASWLVACLQNKHADQQRSNPDGRSWQNTRDRGAAPANAFLAQAARDADRFHDALAETDVLWRTTIQPALTGPDGPAVLAAARAEAAKDLGPLYERAFGREGALYRAYVLRAWRQLHEDPPGPTQENNFCDRPLILAAETGYASQ